MTHALSDIIDLANAPTPPRWFEFVFEPDKLERHIEVSPIELIKSFFRNITDTESISTSIGPGPTVTSATISANGTSDNSDFNELCDVVIPPSSYEAKYRLKKTYALHTLAIKVASYLEWDLNMLCDGLTIPIQFKLLQALKSACQSEKCPTEVKKFSSVLYCRWFLRSAIAYKLSTLQPQTNSTTIIYLSQLQQQQQTADSLAFLNMSELFSDASRELKSCSDELYDYILELASNKENKVKKLKTTCHPFEKAKLSRPKIGCFNSRDEELNNWDECEPIEPLNFIEAACYDLGRFYFFQELYPKSKQILAMIENSLDKFPLLGRFIQSASDILKTDSEPELENGDDEETGHHNYTINDLSTSSDNNYCDNLTSFIRQRRKQTENYLIDCMNQIKQAQTKELNKQATIDDLEDDFEEDSDFRLEQLQGANHQKLPENSAWYLQIPSDQQQQQLLEMGKGDLFMSRGNFKQAMGCFVGALMLMTDYFRVFSRNYIDEEPYVTRMIQCSISLSCFTQAVALCQMTKNLNYTIAFKQLNERICNDCCDDIYECIWNVTLLEYIINLHARRGEVERRTKVIQLIGQLELNENNPEEILKEAEHVRRGRFFRIMSNKYL